MCDLIHGEGLECVGHDVTTDDGYILTVFRVNKSGMPAGAKAVFLQHGLFSESTTWAVRGAESLVNVLANEGYDVWVGNNRGNVYGRRNTKLDAARDSEKFFDYSFYENGKYDTTKQVSYALATSGQSKLTYVGHSQGTTQMFAMLSDTTFFNDKVDMFIACAPIVYLNNN